MSTKSRESYLLRTYGITLEQFNVLKRRTRGRCPVCRRRWMVISGVPHVDHDHVTGEIRGLLCSNCNHRVVGRHRDPEILKRAARYLARKGTGWFVPKRKRRRKRKSKK